jgi:uncharacterized membrane protein YdfJ with MMPL/SSD domain
LTYIVGFGSFALGYASTFGVTFSGLAAITLLPALLAWLKGSQENSQR